MHNSITRRHTQTLASLVVTLLLVGCGPAPSNNEPAASIAQRYYDAIKNNDLQGAASLFLSTPTQPHEFWVEQLEEHREKLGDLQSYEIRDTNVNTVYSGRRFSLRVSAQYSKHPATETLILFEDVAGNPTRIEAVSIISPGMPR